MSVIILHRRLTQQDFTEMLDNEYTFDQIRKAILELDESSKEIISLKFIEEKSY